MIIVHRQQLSINRQKLSISTFNEAKEALPDQVLTKDIFLDPSGKNITAGSYLQGTQHRNFQAAVSRYKKGDLKNAHRIFTKSPIRKVIAASGIRTINNKWRMDWVLIETDGKKISKSPPRPSHIPKTLEESWPESNK